MKKIIYSIKVFLSVAERFQVIYYMEASHMSRDGLGLFSLLLQNRGHKCKGRIHIKDYFSDYRILPCFLILSMYLSDYPLFIC